MTLDEAIKHCEEVAEKVENDCIECAKEHRKLAEWLKELKQFKEQEPCEDCISRQAILKAISTWDKFGCDADTKLIPYKDHYVPYIHYDDVINCIKDMPPVTPRPKMGYWKVVSDGYGDNAYICECSECKDTVWVYKDADKKWNYCPNCGAKMQEVKE